jgi:uncharacterized Zn-binding protein involved in type VI secretion
MRPVTTQLRAASLKRIIAKSAVTASAYADYAAAGFPVVETPPTGANIASLPRVPIAPLVSDLATVCDTPSRAMFQDLQAATVLADQPQVLRLAGEQHLAAIDAAWQTVRKLKADSKQPDSPSAGSQNPAGDSGKKPAPEYGFWSAWGEALTNPAKDHALYDLFNAFADPNTLKTFLNSFAKLLRNEDERKLMQSIATAIDKQKSFQELIKTLSDDRVQTAQDILSNLPRSSIGAFLEVLKPFFGQQEQKFVGTLAGLLESGYTGGLAAALAFLPKKQQEYYGIALKLYKGDYADLLLTYLKKYLPASLQNLFDIAANVFGKIEEIGKLKDILSGLGLGSLKNSVDELLKIDDLIIWVRKELGLSDPLQPKLEAEGDSDACWLNPPMAARVTDGHECPGFSGPILPLCCTTVLIEGLNAARAGDFAACISGKDEIAEGEKTVLVGKLPAARIGDRTAKGGNIVTAAKTVKIGKPNFGSLSSAPDLIAILSGSDSSSSASDAPAGSPGAGASAGGGQSDCGNTGGSGSKPLGGMAPASQPEKPQKSPGDGGTPSDDGESCRVLSPAEQEEYDKLQAQIDDITRQNNEVGGSDALLKQRNDLQAEQYALCAGGLDSESASQVKPNEWALIADTKVNNNERVRIWQQRASDGEVYTWRQSDNTAGTGTLATFLGIQLNEQRTTTAVSVTDSSGNAVGVTLSVTDTSEINAGGYSFGVTGATSTDTQTTHSSGNVLHFGGSFSMTATLGAPRPGGGVEKITGGVQADIPAAGIVVAPDGGITIDDVVAGYSKQTSDDGVTTHSVSVGPFVGAYGSKPAVAPPKIFSHGGEK